MNDNVFNSLNNLINVSKMGHLPTLASQLGSVHSASVMAKKLMEIECSPALSAIEKSLSRYDDILKGRSSGLQGSTGSGVRSSGRMRKKSFVWAGFRIINWINSSFPGKLKPAKVENYKKVSIFLAGKNQ